MESVAKGRLLDELDKFGVASMSELKAGSGLTWGALYEAVRDMEAAGIIGTRVFQGRPRRRLVWRWHNKRRVFG